MADTILTLKQIEDIFWNLSCTLIGLNPANPGSADKVRIAWPEDGAPAWRITEDVIFLSVVPVNNPYVLQRDTEYGSGILDVIPEVTAYTRVHLVKWVLYGPNSYDKAEMVRNGLYKSKSVLGKSNLYLLPTMDPPIRTPELFNGRWWQRVNFQAVFNEKVTRNETVPYLKGANIRIKTEEGVTQNVDPTT